MWIVMGGLLGPLVVASVGVAGLPKMRQILPMVRAVLLGFAGAQGLDLVGPAEVFAGAARYARQDGYAVIAPSEAGGPVRTTSGVDLLTRPLRGFRLRPADTVLAVGGSDAGVRDALAARATIDW